jgi:hypothetical protein
MIDRLPQDADGDALRRLIATGSDISKKMEIDFAVHVADRSTGLAFAAVVEQMGFRTDVQQGGKTGKWTCYCIRTMIPSYDAIIDVQKTLGDIGRPYNAKPDGWGSFGNAEDKHKS